MEQLIITTKLSDKEIAQRTGIQESNITRVRNQKEVIQKILDNLSEIQKNNIRKLSSYNPYYIAKRTNLSVDVIKVFLKEESKNRTVINNEKKQINYKIAMMQFKSMTDTMNQTNPATKSMMKVRAEKILLEYEDFLTELDYAYLAFCYLKIGNYIDAIELGEEYLGLTELTELTTTALTKKINEMIEKAAQEKKSQEVKREKITGDER